MATKEGKDKAPVVKLTPETIAEAHQRAMALAMAGKSIVKKYERNDAFDRFVRSGRKLNAEELILQFERMQQDEDAYNEQLSKEKEIGSQIEPLQEMHRKMKNKMRKEANDRIETTRYISTNDEIAETKETQAVLDMIASRELQVAHLQELQLKQVLAEVPAAEKAELYRTGAEELDRNDVLGRLLEKQLELEHKTLKMCENEVRPPKGMQRHLFRRALENNHSEAVRLRNKLVALHKEEKQVAQKYHFLAGSFQTEDVRKDHNIFVGAESAVPEVVEIREMIEESYRKLEELTKKKGETLEQIEERKKVEARKKGARFVFGVDYEKVVKMVGPLAEQAFEKLQNACNEYLAVREKMYWLHNTGTENEKTQVLLDIATMKKKDLDDLLKSVQVAVPEKATGNAAKDKQEQRKRMIQRIAFIQVQQRHVRAHPVVWNTWPVDVDVYRVPKARNFYYLQATRKIPPQEKAEKGFQPDINFMLRFLKKHEIKTTVVEFYETEKQKWCLSKRVHGLGRPTEKRERKF